MSDRPSPARFPTTHWSCIARAGVPASTEARRALAELCGAYWYPIYALIRRKGHDPDQALDLTQGYFARLLENGTVAAADPAKGRFRSFLFADCSFFLADQGDRDRALKRGGGRPIVSIDARDAEGRFLHEPAHGETAERLYERDWALALIGRVFDRLQATLRRHQARRAFSSLETVVDARARRRVVRDDRRRDGDDRGEPPRRRPPPAESIRASGSATKSLQLLTTQMTPPSTPSSRIFSWYSDPEPDGIRWYRCNISPRPP